MSRNGSSSYHRLGGHSEPLSVQPGPSRSSRANAAVDVDGTNYRDIDPEMKHHHNSPPGDLSRFNHPRRFTAKALLSAAAASAVLTLALAYTLFTTAASAFSCPPCSSSPTTPTAECRPPLDPSGYLCAPNGAPPSVARSRGCELDTLSFHWYPSAQHHDADNLALLRAFDAAGPWHRYRDSAGVHEIDPSAPESEQITDAWVTRREHATHCVFTLRQTHLWFEKGWDPPFNYSHTVHCTGYLLDALKESPPSDWERLTVHATAWPERPQVVKPWYPCEEEGLSCVSW